MRFTEQELYGVKIRTANARALFALLLDRFPGLTIPAIMRLTQRQIKDFYLHKRDKKTGAIKEPVFAEPVQEERPESYEEALATLDTLAAAFHMPDEEKAKVKEKLDQKFNR